MTPALIVVGIIAYLNPSGAVVATHVAAFSSVAVCKQQAAEAIAADMAATKELKGTHAVVNCWDTRYKKEDEVNNHISIPQSEADLQVFPFYKSAESIWQRA